MKGDFECSLRESIQIHFTNIEKTLNIPITKFYNGDDVKVIVAELQLTKTKKQCQHM